MTHGRKAQTTIIVAALVSSLLLFRGTPNVPKRAKPASPCDRSVTLSSSIPSEVQNSLATLSLGIRVGHSATKRKISAFLAPAEHPSLALSTSAYSPLTVALECGRKYRVQISPATKTSCYVPIATSCIDSELFVTGGGILKLPPAARALVAGARPAMRVFASGVKTRAAAGRLTNSRRIQVLLARSLPEAGPSALSTPDDYSYPSLTTPGEGVFGFLSKVHVCAKMCERSSDPKACVKELESTIDASERFLFAKKIAANLVRRGIIPECYLANLEKFRSDDALRALATDPEVAKFRKSLSPAVNALIDLKLKFGLDKELKTAIQGHANTLINMCEGGATKKDFLEAEKYLESHPEDRLCYERFIKPRYLEPCPIIHCHYKSCISDTYCGTTEGLQKSQPDECITERECKDRPTATPTATPTPTETVPPTPTVPPGNADCFGCGLGVGVVSEPGRNLLPQKCLNSRFYVVPDHDGTRCYYHPPQRCPDGTHCEDRGDHTCWFNPPIANPFHDPILHVTKAECVPGEPEIATPTPNPSVTPTASPTPVEDESCCKLPDGNKNLPVAECLKNGGQTRSGRCEENACCSDGKTFFNWDSIGKCNYDLVDASNCDPACCRITAGTIMKTKGWCEARGAEVVPDDAACPRVCCRDIFGRVSITGSECPEYLWVSGEACETVCCGTTTQFTLAGNCPEDRRIEKSQCETVCCGEEQNGELLGYEELSRANCAAPGSDHSGTETSDKTLCETVCCQTKDSKLYMTTRGTCEIADVVVDRSQCESSSSSADSSSEVSIDSTPAPEETSSADSESASDSSS